VHAYRGRSLDDQVEVVAGLALADDDRAGREVARFGFGREQVGDRQRQRREHRQGDEQPGLRVRRGHRLVQAPEPGGVGQGQAGQSAAV